MSAALGTLCHGLLVAGHSTVPDMVDSLVNKWMAALEDQVSNLFTFKKVCDTSFLEGSVFIITCLCCHLYVIYVFDILLSVMVDNCC